MAISISVANRLGLDYRAEALRLAKHQLAIIDVHSHISGSNAARVYGEVRRHFGVSLTYSMTQLEQVPSVIEALGSTVRFIAVPRFRGGDPLHDFAAGYSERLEKFHKLGARIAKFFAAPRSLDFGYSAGKADLFKLDSPMRRETMQTAASLGMIFMTHVGDPDTWFKTKYSDSARYGSKLSQYEPFERVLSDFPNPWIAAHMAGWPEDLDFLSALLSRHSNLYLDSSATKWMVRELSRHPREKILEFFSRWQGRILFGSDIVASEGDISATQSAASSTGLPAPDAFDLYASRYWALRTLFESNYNGESPIADPDLHMVDAQKFKPHDAPQLSGKSLPWKILKNLYHDAAQALLEPLYAHR